MRSTKEVMFAILAGEKVSRKELVMCIISMNSLLGELKTYSKQVTINGKLPIEYQAIGKRIQQDLDYAEDKPLDLRMEDCLATAHRTNFNLSRYLMNKVLGDILD